MASLVLIGYGNALRSDDGAGPAVIERLRARGVEDRRTVLIAAHQLTPEMAITLAGAHRVVFFDASIAAPPGVISTCGVVPGVERLLGHRLSPAGLLDLTQAAFGRAPRGRAWTIGAGCLDMGESLSAAVEQSVERIARRVAGIMRRCRPVRPDV